MNPTSDTWAEVFAYMPQFLSGLRITVEVSVIAFICSLFLGIVGAAARRSKHLAARLAATVYVEAFRNTPLLLQVFIAYFGLPAIGLPISAFQAGTGALAVNAGAYLTEIIRGGIEAVPQGQYDATHVLALSRLDAFTHVVLPQAVRNVYPPIINQFIQILLGSSLLSAIALPELTGVSETVNSITLRTMQVFAVALVLYLVVSNAISLLASLVGRYAFRPPLETRADSGFFRRWTQAVTARIPSRGKLAEAGEGGGDS